MSWPEVSIVLKEHRKELVINGSDESDFLQRIETGGLDERIFSLRSVNLLEITKCKLTGMPARVGEMTGLTSLLLHHNMLLTVPESINMLSKLLVLDLSFNQLEKLPPLDRMANLDTLNVSSNNLTELPDLSSLANLHVIIAGNNCLTAFPPSLISEKLVHLHTLLFADNQIEDIPAKISCLKALKNLDLSNNKVKIVPAELSLCLKMKDLGLRGNKLADRRLLKLVDQLHTKHVTDYLTQIYEKEEDVRQKEKKSQQKKLPPAPLPVKVEDFPPLIPVPPKAPVEEVIEPLEPAPEGKFNVRVLHFDAGIKAVIEQKDSVLVVRPHILACIVRNLDLKRSANMFKRFISMQNKLHDDVCDKRQAATIAVHELNNCFFPLSYEGKPSHVLEITPLFGTKAVPAKQLVIDLVNEADEIRRQKKRNTIGGLHKYLGMVRGAQTFACLIDSQATVISFPPITNALKTKCSAETKDVLLEITSSKSMDACRVAMNALIQEIVKLSTNPAPEKPVEFVFEQVRVHDSKGQLKSVFPSSTDFKDDPQLEVTFVYPEGKKGG